MKGEVHAVCLSEAKGTAKHEVDEARLVADHGMAGDAHAGKWHRQVSLLATEKVDRFRETGIDVENGAFGENMLVSGIDLAALPVGTILIVGDAQLEVTQIGKICHTRCRIYDTVGDCIMPREGIFARVLKGGAIRKGDPVHVS